MKNNQNEKIKVAILFGGKSAEHEVSVKSARNIIQAIDKNKYEISLIGIDKSGRWGSFCVSQLLDSNGAFFNSLNFDNNNSVTQVDCFDFLKPKRTEGIDVVFPVLHGPMGEDGTVQGFLKLANVPFVGSGVLGSSVSMDKDVAKRLLRDAGLPIVQFLVFNKYERKKIIFEKIKKSIGIPFFIKPANLGSSVGITKVCSRDDLVSALDLAFSYDNKILIERNIQGKEIECAVLGNEKPIASVCGEIIPTHEFYSYEAKYLDENGAIMAIPAKITKRLESKIQKIALETFKTLGCEGMARVDFFVTKDERIFINEVNTIPGFTSVSMYPKLWEISGITYKKLIDELIRLAIERFHTEQKLVTTFFN